jgi:hypothetical protein
VLADSLGRTLCSACPRKPPQAVFLGAADPSTGRQGRKPPNTASWHAQELSTSRRAISDSVGSSMVMHDIGGPCMSEPMRHQQVLFRCRRICGCGLRHRPRRRIDRPPDRYATTWRWWRGLRAWRTATALPSEAPDGYCCRPLLSSWRSSRSKAFSSDSHAQTTPIELSKLPAFCRCLGDESYVREPNPRGWRPP